ncbi:LOW QUALITY PROTEIN: hypothetical protein PHMEG_0004784 [Phytophthora megakarya]|uniref:Uncharacterized protein n=1 Tax=Phytophthora megakarya TaxID=4795 RepID=A0A225WUK7_9STRA|nr:LOW QUALITY PROTEIN: hypothetical protein PHMEG_0004784 [Phytophthora megakarya]
MSTFRYQVQVSTTQMSSPLHWSRFGQMSRYLHAGSSYCDSRTKLAAGKDFVKERVQPHPRLLHDARSLKRFRSLAKRVLTSWKAENEGNLANWLQSVYLTPRWESWHVGSSSVPGFSPTQQPIESHHKIIKAIVTDFKKAPTLSVLNSVLPWILLYDATTLSSGNRGHFAEGMRMYLSFLFTILLSVFVIDSLPLGAVMQAKDNLIVSQNHCIRSLRDWLGNEEPIEDTQVIYLSLHQVTLKHQLLSQMEPLPLRSKWQFPEIRSIRNALSYTCKRYKHPASLHLLHKLNIERTLETILMLGLHHEIGTALQQDQ